MSIRCASSRLIQRRAFAQARRSISQSTTRSALTPVGATTTPTAVIPPFLDSSKVAEPKRDTPKSTKPAFDPSRAAKTLPPNYKAQVRELKTFHLPDKVTESDADRQLGKELVDAWRADGILQIAFPPGLKVLKDAIKQSKAYFASAYEEKSKCLDDQSFAGYVASGEELTDGVADYSEIFTVMKDLKSTDPRVRAKWPCHGPCPWPNEKFERDIQKYMQYQGEVGEKLLKLTALGLGLSDPLALNKLTHDGWHHMRVLRFPPTNDTNCKCKEGRGIGSHTDYGLLVIASQDEVGGLFIRPPYEGEQYANWDTSAAGMHEHDDKWLYVPPVDDVFTCFPGDMMQYMTNSYLPSTPHKVGLNTRERFAFAYFHEPNFNALCKPLPELANPDDAATDEPRSIHYGTHFTNMFMRNYPDRITAKRMHAEHRQDRLAPMQSTNGFSFD